MSKFCRSISSLDEFKKCLNSQENAPIFQKLCRDIETGVVFPAIREEFICFYYKGSRLFVFDCKNGFRTHAKYAAAINKNAYISQSEYTKDIFFANFSDAYDRIKENAALYAGLEAKGVADLYHKSFGKDAKQKYLVLDIEIAFAKKVRKQTELKDDLNSDVPDEDLLSNADEITQGKIPGPKDDRKNKHDRFDILLLEVETGTLRFVEAKHYLNKELWAQKGTRPKVTSQIKRYLEVLNTPTKKNEIIETYSGYIKELESLFPIKTHFKMDTKLEIDSQAPVALWVFGFDKDQREGRLKDLLINDNSLADVPYYLSGDTKNVEIQTVWEQIKKTQKA